jgi:hypothetical protein
LVHHVCGDGAPIMEPGTHAPATARFTASIGAACYAPERDDLAQCLSRAIILTSENYGRCDGLRSMMAR